MHGLRHLPTPGTPGYAALKIASDVAHHGGRR
jgi:hypothetical protein